VKTRHQHTASFAFARAATENGLPQEQLPAPIAEILPKNACVILISLKNFSKTFPHCAFTINHRKALRVR
jgi:hypothetical protein